MVSKNGLKLFHEYSIADILHFCLNRSKKSTMTNFLLIDTTLLDVNTKSHRHGHAGERCVTMTKKCIAF